MATTITISGHDHARLEAFGLADAPDMETMEFRNERPSGYGDNEGEWFATIENHQAPDGRTYHVLITGTHGNDHSPGASHYTTWELYPLADSDAVSQFAADVAEWEGKPDDDPDYEDSDADSDPEEGDGKGVPCTYHFAVDEGTIYAGNSLAEADDAYEGARESDRRVSLRRDYGQCGNWETIREHRPDGRDSV